MEVFTVKKIFTIVLLTLFALGCGRDGRDGKAFLSFTWDWYVDSYWDNNPDVPSHITEYTKYELRPGTYNFSYDCSDGLGNYWGYDGTYKITIDKGEKGGFLVDGNDGEDNYFRMNLTGQGPNFYLMKGTQDKKLILEKRLFDDLSNYKKLFIGEVITEVFYSNSGQMIVQKRMYQWVKK